MKNRDDILAQILKNAEQGDFELDPFILRSGDIAQDVQQANALQERALGQQLLEQFKGRIPNKKTTSSELRDFAEGLREQFTPDVKSAINIEPEFKHAGLYSPKKDLVQIAAKQGPKDFASTAVHEFLHGRDYKAGDYGDTFDLAAGKEFNKKLKPMMGEIVDEAGNVIDRKMAKSLIERADINDLKELLLKGHHGFKRGATIAQANIPRLLKGLPVLGAAGAALLSQDASAAVPLLSEADDVGESIEEERQMLAEDKARKAYSKSPAHQDRLSALRGLLKKPPMY